MCAVNRRFKPKHLGSDLEYAGILPGREMHIVFRSAGEMPSIAFEAKELTRIPGPDGRLLHASLKIGDSALMMSGEFPEWGGKGPLALGGSPVTIHLYVEDVDAAWSRAVDAGCEIAIPLEDTFWGDVSSKQEAIEIAKQCPATKFATVEVRELAPCYVA